MNAIALIIWSLIKLYSSAFAMHLTLTAQVEIAWKSNEYHCKNQKCVSMPNRCNGVDNGGDSSDEQNCKMSF
ncbi:hypothetical protein HZS_1509 [Henneguya salminicola]|nr:hypothetical protein HZS_1509 [Henneguya salminicola]